MTLFHSNSNGVAINIQVNTRSYGEKAFKPNEQTVKHFPGALPCGVVSRESQSHTTHIRNLHNMERRSGRTKTKMWNFGI